MEAIQPGLTDLVPILAAGPLIAGNLPLLVLIWLGLLPL